MSLYLHKTLPAEAPPPTPLSDEAVDVLLSAIKPSISKLIQVTKKYGTIVGYKQEQNGQLIQHVFPKKSNELAQTSGSSKVKLQLHTETAFHPYKPDYVALMCIRPDPSAATVYADVDDILKRLPLWAVHELHKNSFVTRVDASFRTRGEPDQEVNMPVLVTAGGKTTISFDADLMSGIDDAGSQALDCLRNAADAASKHIVLDAGDVVVMDNSKIVHGRSQFTPRYDGSDRWLLRVLLRKKLPPAADYNNGVVTTTNFSII